MSDKGAFMAELFLNGMTLCYEFELRDGLCNVFPVKHRWLR